MKEALTFALEFAKFVKQNPQEIQELIQAFALIKDAVEQIKNSKATPPQA